MSNVETKGTLSTLDVKHKIPSWIKTMRVQTALVTSLTLWAGYITVSPLNVESTLALGFIGVFFHIFGFTLNEVKDREYDSSIGNGSVHPIARGEVDHRLAKHIAWGCYFMAVLISLVSGYSVAGTLILATSVIPAHMYNKYSKVHWWSNVYLSLWASMMVLAGSLYAGQPNMVTAAVIGIVALQIFVQVMQGDLKDLTGDEESVCRRLGVTIKSGKEYANDKVGMDLDTDEITLGTDAIVVYTKKFVGLVYSLKIAELALFAWIAHDIWSSQGDLTTIYGILYFLLVISFITTLSMIMVYVYQRGNIKKYSSMHELTWIILLGVTLYGIDPRSGIFVGIAPVVWYVVVNKVLHSGALNPDI